MNIHHSLLSHQIKPQDYLRPWLECEQSLTNKLKSYAKEINSTLLKQHWIVPNWWDLQMLGMKETILERKILITDNRTNYWFARTVIPITTYNKNKAIFDPLNYCALGEILFNPLHQIKRTAYTCYPVNPTHIEFNWVKEYIPEGETILWARLSEFSLLTRSKFYLTEILFPTLMAL